MSTTGAKRTPTGGARLVAYGCFAFSGVGGVVFGCILTLPLDPEFAGAMAMLLAFTLLLPMVPAALLGVVLSLILRKPRGLLLLGGLTVLEAVFLLLLGRLPVAWTAELSDLVVGLSALAYGVLTLGVSVRLWFYQVFRAPWEQSEDQALTPFPSQPYNQL